MYQHIRVPAQGQKITVNADFPLDVPAAPIQNGWPAASSA